MRAALIPMKSPEQAKSRLAQALGDEARAELCRAMLTDVIVACTASGCFDTVTVLSDDSEVLWQARELGARPLAEPATLAGLNESLTFGQRYLSRRLAAGELVIVPADVPLIGPEDIRRLVDALSSAPTPAVVIVRARDGGTNALAMRPPEAIPMRFGIKSADAHLAAASDAGITGVEIQNERLAFDVDSPADVTALTSLAAGPATAAWIAARSTCAAQMSDE